MDENKGRERGELSETELDGVAGGFNPFSKDDWKKAGNTVVNTVNNVVDSGHEAAQKAAKALEEATEQAKRIAQAEAEKAKKNPSGTVAQFSGAGIVGTLIDQAGGKKPNIPGMPIGGPLSGASLFEQAGNIVKGTPKAGTNPSDILPKNVTQFVQETIKNAQQTLGQSDQQNPKPGPKLAEMQEQEKIKKLAEQQDKMQEAIKKQQDAEAKKKPNTSTVEQQIASTMQQMTGVLKKPFGKF